MRKTFRTTTAILLALGASALTASAIDINGGSSWGGWTLQGRSDASGIYGAGPTANPYNVYTTVFTYSGNPVTGSPAGGSGQGAAGVFGGGFQAGDVVIGVGVDMLAGQSVANFLPTLKFDIANNSYLAASTVGGTDGHISGSTWANAGDFNMNANVGPGWRPGDLAIYNGLGGNQSGGVINILDVPLASFAQSDSYQLFVDLTRISSFAAANGRTTPIPAFGNELTLAINGFGTNTAVIDNLSTQPLSDPPSSVPDGGTTLALLGGALAGLVAFRRKLT
jgi:hypothetical protein